MGAVLSRGCAADGVNAWQDNADPKKFYYLPARIDAVLGETLLDFSVTYFGISEDVYWVDMGGRTYKSAVGGVLSGRATPDITKAQKAAIIEEIAKQYQIDNPNLTPLVVSDVTVQPVFAKNITDMGMGSSATFPQVLQFGSTFNYNVSSGNSLFAQLVGRRSQDGGNKSNPEFGVNIAGTAEFYGDPWEARIQCDLSQVWEYTRRKVSGGVSLGWLSFGGDLDKIAQSLIKDNVVKVTYIEGSGGEEFGRQLLESTKKLFEAINSQVTAGEGFFRFEPNPAPQAPPAGKEGLGASLMPWTASVNTAVGANVFKQSIKYDQTISFQGKLDVPVNSSMNLAVGCTPQTSDHFHDLQQGFNGCIDRNKADGLQRRMQTEVDAKDAKVLEYLSYVESGRWTVADYAKMLALLDTISLTESSKSTRSPAGDITITRLSLAEARAQLEEHERRVFAAQVEPVGARV